METLQSKDDQSGEFFYITWCWAEFLLCIYRNESLLSQSCLWIYISSRLSDLFKVAVKSIRKEKIKDEQDLVHIRREIEIMSSMCHPHIISIYEGA